MATSCASTMTLPGLMHSLQSNFTLSGDLYTAVKRDQAFPHIHCGICKVSIDAFIATDNRISDQKYLKKQF